MKNLIVVLCLFLVVISCKQDKKAQLEKLKKQEAELSQQIKALEKEIALTDTTKEDSSKIKVVAVAPVQLGSFKHFIEIQGRVDATENINVSPKMAGLVTKIYVKEGDEVRTGQVLAEVDDQLVLQSIEEVNSSLSLATTMYERQKNLWDQKIGSEVQYLTAKNQKENLEKRKATLGEQLDMTKIKSPINGTVDLVSLRVGQTTSPGLPSIRVVNLSKLKAKADVAEAYSSKVKKGDDAIVVFPDLNKEIKAKITFVGTVIDQLNRTFSVEVNLDPNIKDYHPNMIAVVRVIDFQNDSSIVVPINVIQNSEEGKYVFLAAEKDGKTVAKKQMVTVGLTYNGDTQISGGLNPGDKLITAGYQDLNDGEVLKF
jgi:membrane fusion protein (multidrug efflux system)